MSGSSNKGSDGIFYLLIGGPLALMWGMGKLKEKRLLENTPTSKVRSAAMGLVELAGQALQRKPLKSPLSNKDCCWWDCQVQEYRQEGKNSRWVTIKHVDSVDLFYLQDETGRVLVNPANAELHVGCNTFDVNASTRSQIAPVLNGWGIQESSWFGLSGRMRILEQVIYHGFPLFVMGELSPTNGPQETVTNEERVWLKAPAESPFVISTKDEKELVNYFTYLAPLGIFGGIALSAAGGWLAVMNGWNPLLIVGLVAAGFILSFFGKSFNVNFIRS